MTWTRTYAPGGSIATGWRFDGTDEEFADELAQLRADLSRALEPLLVVTR